MDLFGINTRRKTKWIAFQVQGDSMTAIALSNKSESSIIDIKTFAAEDMWPAFSRWMKKLDFDGAQVVQVLQPQEYELILTECPPVHQDDMREALFWKSHEIGDFEPDTTAFEYFELPGDSYRGRVKMVYGVAVPKQLIIETEAAMKRLKLSLSGVTITELAFGHLLASKDAGSFLALSFHDDLAMVTAYHNNAMYFTRQFTIGSIDANDQDFLNTIGLEVQRSIDYLESKVGVSPPNLIYIVPTSPKLAYQDIERQLDTVIEQKVKTGLGRHHFSFSRVVEDQELYTAVAPLGGLVQQLTSRGVLHASH